MIRCKNDMKHETSYLPIKFCLWVSRLDTYFYQNFNLGAVDGVKTAFIASIIYQDFFSVKIGWSWNEPLGVFLCLVLQWCFDIGVIDWFITNIYLWKIFMSNMIICTLKCGGDEKKNDKMPSKFRFYLFCSTLGQSAESNNLGIYFFLIALFDYKFCL